MEVLIGTVAIIYILMGIYVWKIEPTMYQKNWYYKIPRSIRRFLCI